MEDQGKGEVKKAVKKSKKKATTGTGWLGGKKKSRRKSKSEIELELIKKKEQDQKNKQKELAKRDTKLKRKLFFRSLWDNIKSICKKILGIVVFFMNNLVSIVSALSIFIVIGMTMRHYSNPENWGIVLVGCLFTALLAAINHFTK